jgi:NDP-sugar pyrophosphorylase family protein
VSSERVVEGGIIAAGQGIRLRKDGWAVPKPLVPVCGIPLLEHVVRNFEAAGIRSLAVIFNEEEQDCAEFLERRFPEVDLRILVKTTSSSLESFRHVAGMIAGRLRDRQRALVSTVDALCAPADFRTFVESAGGYPAGATVLAVTPLIADERPLRARLDEAGRIVSLGDLDGDVVTAGMYLAPGRVLRNIPAEGLPRLRDFLRWLLDRGEPIFGVTVPAVVDVDRGEDVQLAEMLLGGPNGAKGPKARTEGS